MVSNITPRRSILIALGLLFAVYVLYQARFLVFGPHVSIDEPANNAVISTSTVTLAGHARNAAFISLNGAQIYTDATGRWSEQLIAPAGVSIMTATVRDRFGREAEATVRLIRN